jgi:putative hydrolase of the HAD superfamily
MVFLCPSNNFAAMRYKHLFFDLDHTLWDFETNARLTLQTLYQEENLIEQGVTTDFNLFFSRYSYHNERLWARYTRGFIKQEELRWKRMWFTLLDDKIANEGLSKQLSARFLELLPVQPALFPYTREILMYLQVKNYQLHLITNGFETVQHRKLQYSNLSSYFTHVITSEASNSLKPHPEIFAYALQKAGAQKEESIMIGDNLDADIQGAINAGLDTIFVNHIGATTQIKPTYTIHHLKELETIF